MSTTVRSGVTFAPSLVSADERLRLGDVDAHGAATHDGDVRGRGSGDPAEKDAVAFVGVAKYPARIKCALLGWMAFKDAAAQATAAHQEFVEEQA